MEKTIVLEEFAKRRSKRAELVKKYGESLYMINNTDGYYVCRGMWEKENEDAVFALDEGEISEVIKSGYFSEMYLTVTFLEKVLKTLHGRNTLTRSTDKISAWDALSFFSLPISQPTRKNIYKIESCFKTTCIISPR